MPSSSAFATFFFLLHLPAKTSISPRSLLLGTFHAEERLRLGQKFHTDDANQCLPNKSGGHGVLNIFLSNFTCLLVDFVKVLCSCANELQQISNASSREHYILPILTVLLEILHVYI